MQELTKPLIVKSNDFGEYLENLQQNYGKKVTYEVIGYDNKESKEIAVFYDNKKGLNIHDLIVDILSKNKKELNTEKDVAKALYSSGYGNFLLEADKYDPNDSHMNHFLKQYLQTSKKNKIK